MKENNSVTTYSVFIYDGTEIFAKKENFTDANEAVSSAKRIIKSQKEIDPLCTSYAMVWNGKRMISYID